MKARVFLVHGFEGAPNGGWRPWLMGELDKKDVYACSLPMPRPDAPVPSEWVSEIRRAVDLFPADQIYLVGHSLGAPAILRYLESASPIAGAVFVGAPVERTTLEAINPFFEPAFDLPALKTKARAFAVIHGDDDPLVPYEEGKVLAEGLGSTLITVKGGKHLNGAAGFRELPQALDALLSMMGYT